MTIHDDKGYPVGLLQPGFLEDVWYFKTLQGYISEDFATLEEARHALLAHDLERRQSLDGHLVESIEIVSKPGAGVTLTVLHLTEAGKLGLYCGKAGERWAKN